MALTDQIAAHVLGEVYELARKIDDQQVQVANSISSIHDAAELIQKNSTLAVKNARVATEYAQQESRARFEENMSVAVSKTLNKVARAVALESATRWFVAGVVLAVALTVASGWVAYSKGKDAGISHGYAQARDEVVAAAWANTSTGKLAYQLAKAGSLEELAHCSRPGWKESDGVCFAHPTDGKIHGWRLR